MLLDEERDAMARSRRLERSTNGFSYSSYHTLDEASSRWALEPLGIARSRQRPEKDSETAETINMGWYRGETLGGEMFGGRQP